jgi:hypothetical protein
MDFVKVNLLKTLLFLSKDLKCWVLSILQFIARLLFLFYVLYICMDCFTLRAIVMRYGLKVINRGLQSNSLFFLIEN